MLGKKLIDAESFCGPLELVQGRIALFEAHSVAEVIENGQEFAEAPHAALVKRFAGAAALAPQPLQSAGIGAVMTLAMAPASVFHFKEIAALSAAEVGPGFWAGDAGSASETA